MTAGDSVSELDRFEAPYGREIVLQDVRYESGLNLLRVRIKEGSRFTILDLDAATAKHWSDKMSAWSDSAENG